MLIHVTIPSKIEEIGQWQVKLKFLEVFKKLRINIPFANAPEQMTSPVKFLKDIISRKKKILRLALTEECNAIIL